MRIVLLVLAAILVPAPAVAAEGDATRAIEELSDPARQAQMAAAAEAVTEAVLAMPAAPLLRAAATMAGHDPEEIDPDTRVGDLVGPEAADAPREFAERLPAMMGAMATMAAAFEAMLPQLAEAMKRIEDAAPDDYE